MKDKVYCVNVATMGNVYYMFDDLPWQELKEVFLNDKRLKSVIRYTNGEWVPYSNWAKRKEMQKKRETVVMYVHEASNVFVELAAKNRGRAHKNDRMVCVNPESTYKGVKVVSGIDCLSQEIIDGFMAECGPGYRYYCTEMYGPRDDKKLRVIALQDGTEPYFSDLPVLGRCFAASQEEADKIFKHKEKIMFGDVL